LSPAGLLEPDAGTCEVLGQTAIHCMERHGAEIVTTEMVIFQWLETADNPHFRPAIAVIKQLLRPLHRLLRNSRTRVVSPVMV
jgi:hypothetical protein